MSEEQLTPQSNLLLNNLKISADELPQLEEASYEKLEIDYLYMRLTSRGLFLFIVAGICIVFTFFNNWPLWYWLAPWLVYLGLSFAVEILGFRIKGYAIRSKDVSYKSGLLFFSMTSVPLNRIQHCELSQGPLGRLFDLASVKVYTAGGSSSDMTINGLTKERAQRLRDYIIKLSSEYE